MAKYDSQVAEINPLLQGSTNILVALPTQLTIDNLASGLALFLALKASGKNVTIVSEGNPLVSHGNLFGVGEIKNDLVFQGGGDFVISLEGVVDDSTNPATVPALEKLDWYPNGKNLNLVFHVVPGQRFVPSNVSSTHQEGGIQLIFAVGASSLADLGTITQKQAAIFSSVPIVNLNNAQNMTFGKVNITDLQSSLSEIVFNLTQSLGLKIDADIASNILAGIYSVTNNLTANLTPDVFMVVGNVMQLGGKIPGMVSPVASATLPMQAPQQPLSQPVVTTSPVQETPPVMSQVPVTPVVSPPSAPVAPTIGAPVAPAPTSNLQSSPFLQPQPDTSGLDLSQVFQVPQASLNMTTSKPGETFVTPPVVNQTVGNSNQPSSPEERPMGEFAGSSSPEIDSNPTPDWLVPKIYKGGSVG